jgi:hypothetical protein
MCCHYTYFIFLFPYLVIEKVKQSDNGFLIILHFLCQMYFNILILCTHNWHSSNEILFFYPILFYYFFSFTHLPSSYTS